MATQVYNSNAQNLIDIVIPKQEEPKVDQHNCEHEFEFVDFCGHFCKKCDIGYGVECLHPECKVHNCDKHNLGYEAVNNRLGRHFSSALQGSGLVAENSSPIRFQNRTSRYLKRRSFFMTLNPLGLVISLLPLFLLFALLVFAVWFVIAAAKYAKTMRQIAWGLLACEFYDRGRLSDKQFDAVCEEIGVANQVPHIGQEGDRAPLGR